MLPINTACARNAEFSTCLKAHIRNTSRYKELLPNEHLQLLMNWHSAHIQKLTHFEENEPIETCGHSDDNKYIGQITSIVHQEFHNGLQFKKNDSCYTLNAVMPPLLIAYSVPAARACSLVSCMHGSVRKTNCGHSQVPFGSIPHCLSHSALLLSLHL